MKLASIFFKASTTILFKDTNPQFKDTTPKMVSFIKKSVPLRPNKI